MEANELRIGNLIRRKSNYEVLRATTGILSNWDILNTKHPGYEGIPLTEEWLEKFGFKYAKGWNMWQGEIEVYKHKDGSFSWYNEGDVSVPLVYVHQLQNLVFALTGKELEIKDINQ